MDYTVEVYDIRIEVREDGRAAYSIIYVDTDGDKVESGGENIQVSDALSDIEWHVRNHKAGAF